MTRNTGPSRAGWHRAMDFIVCPQFFAYRWVLRLVPKLIERPLARGILGHEALMHWDLGRMTPERRGDREVLDPYVAMQRQPASISYAFNDVKPAVRDYMDEYRREGLEVLDVEPEGEVQLAPGDGGLFTAKVDRVVLQGGGVWFMDRKFVGRPDTKEYRPESWKTDGQVLTLHVMGEAGKFNGRKGAEKAWGRPFRGVILDLIQVGGRGFRRFPVPVGRDKLRQHVTTLRHYYGSISALSSTDPWKYPRASHRAACLSHKGYGRPCPYYDLCHVTGPRGAGAFDQG